MAAAVVAAVVAVGAAQDGVASSEAAEAGQQAVAAVEKADTGEAPRENGAAEQSEASEEAKPGFDPLELDAAQPEVPTSLCAA